MINETIIPLVNQYGYLFFFLAFCLGPFGVPVPNEVTILTGGMLAKNGVLNPYVIYVCILFGLVTAVTIGFFGGKLFTKRIHARLIGFKSQRHLKKSEKLFSKYGNVAICIGFFLPVVRYVVPIFAGVSGVKFKKFALLSYASAIIWTSIFFSLGNAFGEQLFQLLSLVDMKTLSFVVMIASFVFVLNKLRKTKETTPPMVHK